MITVWLGIIFQDDRDVPHFRGPHQYLGLFVWIAVMAQVVLAWYRPHLEASYSSLHQSEGSARWMMKAWLLLTRNARVAWLYSHRLLGCFIYLGGLVNCFLGVDEVTTYVGDASWTTQFDAGGPVFRVSSLGDAVTALLVISALAVGLVVSARCIIEWRQRKKGSSSTNVAEGSDGGMEMT